MSKTYDEIIKEEEKMFKEVIELLKLDGWVKVDGGFDDKVALIFTVYGDIVHRYVKWGSEYSEWHQCSVYGPELYTSDRASLDDIDDYNNVLMGALTIPKLTDNTKKALQIMEDFYQARDIEINGHK